MIHVELRLLAAMKRLLSADRPIFMDAADDATLSGFLDQAGIDRGRTLVVLVNGRYAAPDSRLRDGDVVAVFPPVAGG